ncbi:MAG TPA: HD domain-containing protein [Candidatus Saccharimonadales bacterium]|nr:HD domain-containing protein [Candidatus Saccharimonadales bacterium]
MNGNKNSNNYWGFIKDPIYGYIRLTEVEKTIIDTLAVQRLRRIRQLAGAEYVYPAANHSRFEHVLGAMFLAGAVVDNLPLPLSAEEKQKIRLAALLHDVGHAPFSHLFEPLLLKYLGRNHEDMSTWVIAKSNLAEVIRKQGFDPDEISKLAVGESSDTGKRFLGQIISSSFDVDKMDFVVRDSYHTGAGYGSVDVFRLIYTMDILDGNLAVDITALPTLESLILARLESFRAIYFHRACRAVQMMLLKALDYAKDELSILKISEPNEYLEWDDYIVWSKLFENPKSREIIRALSARKLLKCAYEKTFFVKDELASNVFTKENVRRKLEEEIAQKAGVEIEDVVIDVPSLPSVPYHYAMEIGPVDIPIFSKTRSGTKVPQKITELSKVVDVLQVFMNIIRVYTSERYRQDVGDAATEVLGESPLSNALSY